MSQIVLILGARGRFGRNAAQAFTQAGWQVRRFRRGDDLDAAARGVDVIVNGWNPAYYDWARDVPRLTRDTIRIARQNSATLMIPGNVYLYGPNAPEIFGPDTPQLATNLLGRIRIEMEAAYREAGVQTIILRGGDFIDTTASGNWFDIIITPKAKRGRIVCPGAPDVPRAWAFLPDYARAMVTLAEMRDSLGQFEDIPFPGYTLSGQQMAAAIAEVTGRAQRIKRFNWTQVRLLAPFWKLAPHLLEMRYIWSLPHRLDDTRFAQLLPDFVPTPMHEALRQALPPDSMTPTARTKPVNRPAHP